MLVDFHVHSTASDGTFSPSELAEKAECGGFAAIALTDHDNCDGVAEFSASRGRSGYGESADERGGTAASRGRSGYEESADERGGTAASRGRSGYGEIEPVVLPRSPSALARRVAGVELSIEPGNGFDKFHLLGLGVDPENPQLKALLKSILDGRNARNLRIQSNFERLGIPMPLDPRTESSSTLHSSLLTLHSDIVARPHYARWLMEHGYAGTIKDAFEKYLLPDSPAETRCYEERWHPAQEDAFAAVHAAGGICVMAHPKYWRRAGVDFAAAEKELARLKEAGLDGLEALYQANTQEENVEFSLIATRLRFLKSAGSDFHGANKPTIPLGMEVSESFINPLLERLNLI